MPETVEPLTSPRHPLYQGAVGAILAAVVAAVLGLFVGNTGVVAKILPGAPTVIVTVPGPTVTISAAPPVSTTAPPASSLKAAGAVHLADANNRPEDALVGPNMNDQSNVGINGKTFDAGWTQTIGSTNDPLVLMSINTKRAFSRFQARVGVLDTSAASSAKVEVIADGAVIFSKVVSLQQSYDVNLRVENVQRLDIKMYTPHPNAITLAIGDPTIIP